MTSATEWDGLMLTFVEFQAMQDAYHDGSYKIWRIATSMNYPCSGLSVLFREMDDRYSNFCHRDTAIALVRFIIASRRAAKARKHLGQQIRAEQLRSELSALAEEKVATTTASAV